MLTLFIKKKKRNGEREKKKGGGGERKGGGKTGTGTGKSTCTAARCEASQHGAAHMETQTQARSGGEAENGEEEEQVGWEG